MSNHEDFDELEREIASLTPKVMPPAILDRLATEMAARPRTPWADRCLVGAIGTGLAASVVIVSMLFVQSAANTAPGATTGGPPMAAGGNTQRVGDYLAMYARADGRWAGIIK